MLLCNDIIHLLRMPVRRTVILLHMKAAQPSVLGNFHRKWDTIRSHMGTGMDGNEQKEQQSFWTHACMGPLFRFPSVFIPSFFLPP